MKKVLLRGPILTQSGYGFHSRQVAKYLLSREKSKDLQVAFEATPWGSTSWWINHKMFDGLIGKLVEKCTSAEQFKPDVSIQLQLPDEWDPKLAQTNIGITAGIETDICHPSWTQRANMMSFVIVPSQFAAKSLGTVRDLRIVPESYPDYKLRQRTDIDNDLDRIDADELFVVFGQFTDTRPNGDRKNLFNTLSWLAEAIYINKRNAKIVFKTNFSRNTKIDRFIVNNSLTTSLPREVLTKIVLLHGDLSNEEIRSLYTHKKTQALVNLTRGEGFCLPALEAAVCGLPVIATNATAHTEFLLDSYIPIESDRVNVPQEKIDGRIFVPNSKWYEPRKDSFMQKFADFCGDKRSAFGKAMTHSEYITKEYSQENVCKKYDACFSGIF